MAADLKVYDIFDFACIRDYVRSEGEKLVLPKGRYFKRMGESADKFGVVNSGCFSFSRPDYRGDSQIFSLAFKDELISSVISMPGRRSGFDIMSLCRSEVSVISYNDFLSFINSQFNKVSISDMYYAIAFGFMERGASYRCDSPEMRYRELLDRIPNISSVIPKKAIASYLGVTREHFSRMRAKMENQEC